ncbi:ADH_N domain-containing protein, partial [Caerostris extrusa]
MQYKNAGTPIAPSPNRRPPTERLFKLYFRENSKENFHSHSLRRKHPSTRYPAPDIIEQKVITSALKMASKPKTFKKLMVQKLTSNFREAVSIETVEMCHPGKDEICVKNKFVGVNATDVNMTKGLYSASKTPFGIGFE